MTSAAGVCPTEACESLSANHGGTRVPCHALQRVEPEDIGLTIPGRLGVDTRPDIITRRTTKRYKYDIKDISLDSTFQAKEKLKQVGLRQGAKCLHMLELIVHVG